MGARRTAGPLALLGQAPGFRLLFLAALGSGVGTMLAVIALTVDVYERTGSGAWVSALLIADFLPTIAIGLLLGPLVDRLSRRRLMIGADLVRLAAFLALPFAPNAATIVALALVVGFANGFFRPAAYAGMPNLVDAADLPRANSLLQATDNLTWLLGPLLGGALLAAFGPDVPYLVNAATFAVSALLIARLPARLLASEEPLSRGHWHDLAEGFRVVVRSRALLTVLVAWTIVMGGNAAVNVAEVFLVRDAFDAGNLELGLMMGAAGAGLVLGSLAAGPLLERRPVGLVYGASIATMAVGFALAAVSPSVWAALPCVIVSGIGNGAASVCNPLLVQTGAPDRVRGRAFTVVMSVNFAVLGLGMAVAGPLTDAVGPRWLWGGAAAVFAVAAVVAWVLGRTLPSRSGEADGERLLVAPAAVPVAQAGDDAAPL
ncbi:MAG TPA: MFS transporter [Gaiellaceae bacterium]|nr:MFS transporter [Gaiellaceae bacterium]